MSRDGGPPPELDNGDIAWCHDAVQDVSRTFALTVDALEEPMATRICLGYLLCRIPDTIEDAGHIPPADAVSLLRTYGRALDPGDETEMETFVAEAEPWQPPKAQRSPDWHVVGEAVRVHTAFQKQPPEVREAIAPPVLELVEGMATFVERYAETGGLRLESAEELERYCYYAAGTVGHLITNLLTQGEMDESRQRALYETAEEFGLLLQLVNIAKDVGDDYTEENNVYLPASWLREAGVPQDHVVDPEYRDDAAAVVERTAARARTYLDDAQRYLTTMPLRDGNTLAAWGVPFLLAVGTLRELTERPEDALTDRDVKVSREEVYAVLAATRKAPQETIAELRSAIENRPLHTRPHTGEH